MKSFVLAVAALAAIAIGASLILNSGFQKNAAQAYTTQGVRL